MTTRTTFQSYLQLKDKWVKLKEGSAEKYPISRSEVKAILELEERTDIDLQNVRDFVVTILSNVISDSIEVNDMKKYELYNDLLIVVTTVIDEMKVGRGLEP